MLRTALNKTWKQNLTNKELYCKIQNITNNHANNVYDSQDIAGEVDTFYIIILTGWVGFWVGFGINYTVRRPRCCYGYVLLA